MAVNKVFLVGNLGRKPELRKTGNGKSVCDFSIAVNEKKGEPPLWVKIVVWDKQAESCARFLDKGRQVFVEGRLQIREVEKDGQKRQFTEVVATQVQFLGGEKQEPTQETLGEAADF